MQFEHVHLSFRVSFSCFKQQRHINQKTQTSSFSSLFFSSEIVMRKTETDKKTAESADADANEMTIKNERTAAESDMKTEEKNRQTVTVTVTKAVTIMTVKTNVKTEKMMNFKFKKNIRLLATTQIILRVLFIFQISLLCFHVD